MPFAASEQSNNLFRQPRPVLRVIRVDHLAQYFCHLSLDRAACWIAGEGGEEGKNVGFERLTVGGRDGSVGLFRGGERGRWQRGSPRALDAVLEVNGGGEANDGRRAARRGDELQEGGDETLHRFKLVKIRGWSVVERYAKGFDRVPCGVRALRQCERLGLADDAGKPV